MKQKDLTEFLKMLEQTRGFSAEVVGEIAVDSGQIQRLQQWNLLNMKAEY